MLPFLLRPSHDTLWGVAFWVASRSVTTVSPATFKIFTRTKPAVLGW